MQRITVTIPDEVFERIEKERGPVKRSSYVSLVLDYFFSRCKVGLHELVKK